jgi:hypothetical protein
MYLDAKSDNNAAILLPMNPQQRAMIEDTITKNYFPSKRESNKIYSSDTFTEFLKTNAMTKEGLQQIASFYEVLDEWEKATAEQTFKIKHYFDLLLILAGNVGFLNVGKMVELTDTCVSARHVANMSANMLATQPKTVSAEVLTMSSQHVAYRYDGNMSAL